MIDILAKLDHKLTDFLTIGIISYQEIKKNKLNQSFFHIIRLKEFVVFHRELFIFTLIPKHLMLKKSYHFQIHVTVMSNYPWCN